jgi:hypothetical protein
MLELVAEDAGIEDTLYYLDKALHANVLDLQTHLKVHLPTHQNRIEGLSDPISCAVDAQFMQRAVSEEGPRAASL